MRDIKEEILLNKLSSSKLSLSSLYAPLKSRLGLLFVGSGLDSTNIIVSDENVKIEYDGLLAHYEDTSVHMNSRLVWEEYFKLFLLHIPNYAIKCIENIIEKVKNDVRFIKLFEAEKKHSDVLKTNHLNGTGQIFIFTDIPENSNGKQHADKLANLLGELIYEINKRLPNQCINIDYETSGIVTYDRFVKVFNDNEFHNSIYYSDMIDVFNQMQAGYLSLNSSQNIMYSRIEHLGISESINKNSKFDVNSVLVRKDEFPEKNIVDEFCDMVTDMVNTTAKYNENHIQKFIENNPSILNVFGKDFRLYPKLTLRDESGKELEPDFIIEPLETGNSMIIDLKLPSLKAIKGTRNRESFYAGITNSIKQVKTYSRYFESKTNREWFIKKYGFSTFQPELVLMIGKGYEYHDYNIIHSLRSEDADGVHLLTYEQLINQFQKYENI